MDDQARPVKVGLTPLPPFLSPESLFILPVCYYSSLPHHHSATSTVFLFFSYFFEPWNQGDLRMRESNFAFPAQNRAAVCISSQLYDRRGAPLALLFFMLWDG